jgi:peptidoglycan hydrolase-like protein with peptidoglycan-binding domain
VETGVDSGPDVRQLERNLETLGYGDDLTVDREFTDATAAAVEAWERDLDREDPDGVVEPGDIVYLTAPGKVIGHDAAVGETLTAGAPVVTISGDAQLVVADVPVAALDAWSRGTAVELRWEDHGDVTTGAVSSIGRDAAGSGDAATVEVVVTLDEQVEGRPDQSEVSVSLTSAARAGVVAVPVTAIVAGEDGRPAVRLVVGATERVVAVTTGLVDGGWIEVRGGLSPGDVVRLPS